MKNEMSELTKNEWIVMRCCWDIGKATARQIFEKATKTKSWEYQTVKTMLDRLVTKGYLKRDKLGPLCLFTPGVKRNKAEKKIT